MLTRKGIINQCLLGAFFHDLGGIAKLHGSGFLRYGNYLFFGGGLIPAWVPCIFWVTVLPTHIARGSRLLYVKAAGGNIRIVL